MRSVPGQARTKQQLAAEVMGSIIRLNKERIRSNGAYLRPHDLTSQQVWLLGELPKEGGAPIGSLADVMNCHSSNVTGMVDRLEARGLVTRQPDPSDRRVKLVALTPSGQALRGKLMEIARRAPAALIERLDTGQLETLRELLGKACAGLEHPAEEAHKGASSER
ncbi:MAG TPA: MarR family transcriptional regulator [Actinomycetota bacterium]|nr:MarR family transcriptional regulator [Actinomycetota bacterium]